MLFLFSHQVMSISLRPHGLLSKTLKTFKMSYISLCVALGNILISQKYVNLCHYIIGLLLLFKNKYLKISQH